MREFPRPDVGAVIVEKLEWDGQQVGARRYEPMAAKRAGTVIVYFHGGGWVIGSLDSADLACRELCLATGATVISVDYRLAPEAKFPAAVDDAVLAVRAVAAQYPDRRLVVAGDSAGGNLATVAAIELRDEALVDHQLLIYPVTTCDLHIGFDMTFEGISLYYDEMQLNTDLYIEDASQMSDPRVTPLGADVRGLPPVTMVLAECDPITAQGRLYADALRSAGVEVKERTFDHMFHGFFGLDGLMPEARETTAWIARSLRP
jgi:acetyl esterase